MGKGGGGGGGNTPTLVDDNLKNKQYLRIVDLIGEGQIEGPVGGLHGFRVNGTPVVDKNGNPNINGVTVQWRAGTQSQEPLSDYPFVESEIPVSVEVKNATPILRMVSNKDVDRVRFTLGVSQLVQTDSKGNQSNSTVQLAIAVNDGGGWVHAKTVQIGPGKISGQYLESHTIDAPKKKPFQIRVSRLTDDSKTDQLRNGTVWASYTEITDTLMSYPNSAVVGMRIDRSLFADTPKRTYHIKGMIVQVPDNYDPETRNYKGVWTGRFKPAYTNNPAWIFYDLVTNTRYGIGKLMGSFGCDKFALYAIAQYCDQPVPDGFGGTEPRFTCNAYIATQRKARDVLDDLASVFRGMQVWNGLQLTTFQDRPSDPVWTFTNANVIEGKFNVSSSAKKARHTAIEITWVNPENGWKDERELIQDDELVARLGINVKKVIAFGCTSRGQAHRVGRWIIETEKLETDSITFSTGREGINCIPGDIVEIADNSFAAARVGGRILSFSGKEVRLDAPVEFAKGESGYFSYMGSEGKFVRVDIDTVNGDVVTLKEVPAGLRQWGIFSISKKSLVTRLFRVMSIAEDNKTGNYNFTCIQHEPQKEAIVDNGVDFQGSPATQNVIRIPNIERLSVAYIQDSSQVQARAMWATTTINRNITFDVAVYRDNKVVSRGNTKELEYYFNGLDAGVYMVGVRARDDNGMLGDESKVQMVIGAPAAPSVVNIEPGFFELKAIPHISAPKTLDTQFEFWFSESRISNINEIEAKADFLGIAKFWIKGQLKADTPYWFYVRSINEFGKSHFVEAEGKPNDNAKDILEVVGEQFLSNKAGQRLQEQMDYQSESILINSTAIQQNNRELLTRDGENKAEIKRLDRVFADSETAWAQSIKEVKSSVGENRSAVQENQKSINKLDSSLAESEQRVQAQFKHQSTLIDTKATTVFDHKGGSATYTVRAGIKDANGNYHGAGMVIGAEVKNGQVTTSIGFSANNFAWFNPSSGKMEPFMMAKNGQLFTREEFIEDGSITNAKIGNYIQSRNYITGRAGWKIDKGGGAEFNHVTVRGEIHATSGTFTGTINGADGRFSGAVYATKIVGDVVSVTLGNVSLGDRSSIFFHKRLTESMPFDRVFIYGPIMTQRYVGSSGGSGEASVSIYVNNAHVAGQNFFMESSDRGPQCISGTLFTPPITIPANTTPTIKVVLTTHGVGITYPTPGIGMLFKVSSQWSNM